MATFQKLPRSRYKITNIFGGKQTVEGSSVKNPTTLARLQAFAAPYKGTPEAKAKTANTNATIANRQFAQTVETENARAASEKSLAASKAEAQGKLKKKSQDLLSRADYSKYVSDKGKRGLAPIRATPKAFPSAPDTSLTKSGRSSTPPMKKGSTQPQAYTGEQGDTKKKSGAVTSYQKGGYTYTKNAQGNFQNFSAAKTTVKRKDK